MERLNSSSAVKEFSFSDSSLSELELSDASPKNVSAGFSVSLCSSPPTISRNSSASSYKTYLALLIPGMRYLDFFSKNRAFAGAIRTGSCFLRQSL